MTRNTIRKNINKGFTLSETLVALAILVFFGTIVVYGVDVALRAYRETVYQSNCRILEDNINTAFGGLVRSTNYLKLDATNGDIYFKSDQYSATYGFGRIVVNEEVKDGHTYRQLYLCAEDTRNKDYADCPLVSPASYDNMTLDNVKMTYLNEGDSVMFTLTYTISSLSGDKTRKCECKYRTVNTKSIDGVEASSNITELVIPIVSQSSL